jgi:hypothetical protein
MKKLSRIAIALAIIAILVVPAANAQQYTTAQLYSNSVATVTGLTTNLGVGVTKYEEVAISLKIWGPTAACSNTVTATFAESVNGADYESSGRYSISATANGTTAALVSSNFYIGAAGYFRLAAITNACLTNTYIKIDYSLKPQRFGR